MKRLLQTAGDRNVWENVDEYTFNNRNYALDSKGESHRYTGNYILVHDDSAHEFHCLDLTSNELSIVFRFLGVSQNTGSYPGGYVKEPACIGFKPRHPRQAQIIRMADGSIYKKIAA